MSSPVDRIWCFSLRPTLWVCMFSCCRNMPEASEAVVSFSLPSFETLQFTTKRTCICTASCVSNAPSFLIFLVWGKFNYVLLLLASILILLPLHNRRTRIPSLTSVVKNTARWYCHSFILLSFLRQVHKLFQSEISTECDVVLPLPISSIRFFLKVMQ